jgi:hypothetical protein
LTAASLIAPHLTEENVIRLIDMAQGKTKREIEVFLVRFAPKKPFTPSWRKQSSPDPKKKNVKGPSEESAGDMALVTMDNAPDSCPIEDSSAHSPTQIPQSLMEPATADRYNFRFSAGKGFAEKLDRLAQVLGVRAPHAHLEELLDQALEIALEKKDPKRKLERRKKRQAKKRSGCPGKAEEVEVHPPETTGPSLPQMQEAKATARMEVAPKVGSERDRPPSQTRYIPSDVRERVLQRAGFMCEYCGPEGKRCSCRTALQVEHSRPFAVYGTHDEQYLKAYCPAHNRYAAEKYYGREFIRGKVEARRNGRDRRSTKGEPAEVH